jgi:hypothetical protein
LNCRWAWKLADENGNEQIDKQELFMFIRTYEKFKAQRDGIICLIKGYLKKKSNILERRNLVKLLEVRIYFLKINSPCC